MSEFLAAAAIKSLEDRCNFVRQHARSQYAMFSWCSFLGVLLACAELLMAIYWAGSIWFWFDGGFHPHVIYSTLAVVVVGMPTWLLISKSEAIYDLALNNQRSEEERRSLQVVAAQRESTTSIKELSTAMNAQAQKLESLARSRGDTIISGDIKVSGTGTVIIASDLINSMNQNPEIADALKVVAGFVHDSANEEAKKCLSELLKRANKPEEKVVSGALWDRLVNLLPSISSLTDTYIKLSKHFGIG